MNGSLKLVKAFIKQNPIWVWCLASVALFGIVFFMYYTANADIIKQIEEYGSFEKIPKDEFLGYTAPVYSIAFGTFAGSFWMMLAYISNIALQHQQTRSCIRRGYLMVTLLIMSIVTAVLVGSVALGEKLFPNVERQPHITAMLMKCNVGEGTSSCLWVAADILLIGLAISVIAGTITCIFFKFGALWGIIITKVGVDVLSGILLALGVFLGRTALKIGIAAEFVVVYSCFYFLSKTITLDKASKFSKARKA